MATRTLTQDRLKELLHYDPETGVFTRRVSAGGKKAGSIAGADHNMGYRQISIGGKLYLAHRLAWLYVHGEWPGVCIDHINQVKNDNRIANLRDVPWGVNQENRTRKANKSGIAGVWLDKKKSLWRVSHGRNQLGTYRDFFEACCVRKSSEVAA